MTIKETPYKITAVLRVTATAEFFDDEASEETVRYTIEQDLEDAGFDVDVALLIEQEAVKPEFDSLDGNVGRWRCGNCQVSLGAVRPPYCWHCGRKVKWDDG